MFSYLCNLEEKVKNTRWTDKSLIGAYQNISRTTMQHSFHPPDFMANDFAGFQEHIQMSLLRLTHKYTFVIATSTLFVTVLWHSYPFPSLFLDLVIIHIKTFSHTIQILLSTPLVPTWNGRLLKVHVKSPLVSHFGL